MCVATSPPRVHVAFPLRAGCCFTKKMATVLAADTRPTGLSLYSRYALSGAICCCVTHLALVPLDVVKTRMQTQPLKYNVGVRGAFSTIVREEGWLMLLQGAGPTGVGYFLQGGTKFGLYEFFKKSISNSVGEQRATSYRLPIWLTSGALAESIADVLLCPLEAARIRLVAEPSFAKNMPTAFAKLINTEGLTGLYKGMPPILFKQVPYTMTKFVVFEWISDAIYNLLQTRGYPRQSLQKHHHLYVSLGTGLLAGVAASLVSQPADTVLSKINQEKTSGSVTKAMFGIIRRLGAKGLFLGAGPRAVMVGTMIAGQFFIYDYCKMMFGIHH